MRMPPHPIEQLLIFLLVLVLTIGVLKIIGVF